MAQPQPVLRLAAGTMRVMSRAHSVDSAGGGPTRPSGSDGTPGAGAPSPHRRAPPQPASATGSTFATYETRDLSHLSFDQEPLKTSARLDFVKAQCRERVDWRKAPARVQAAATVLTSRLRRAGPLSDEALEDERRLAWLAAVPWGVTTTDPWEGDLSSARELSGAVRGALDTAIAGHALAKDALVAAVAESAARASSAAHAPTTTRQGSGFRAPVLYPHLCLTGERGVGKARLARGLAHALGRTFHRVSALDIAAESLGRPGELPSGFAQCLAAAGTMNPVVLVENVEQLDNDSNLAAVVAALHPSKSWAFHDAFLGAAVDLTQAIWVFTYERPVSAGVEQVIGEHLMSVPMPGLVASEKLDVVAHSLLREVTAAAGAADGSVRFSDDALAELLNRVAVEPGVSALRRALRLLVRHVVADGHASSREPFTVTPQVVRTVLGAHYVETHSDAFPSAAPSAPRMLPVGTVGSVSYQEHSGGGVDFCEVMALPRGIRSGSGASSGGDGAAGGMLMQTGVVRGGTIVDSAEVALSHAISFCSSRFPENDFFSRVTLHLHWSDGPCDGSSAGVVAAAAFLSAALDTPIRHSTTLTGELTLTGRVLAIGQLHDKVAAAQRAQYELMILPEGNRAEYEALPNAVKNGGMDVAFVSSYAEVHELLLGSGRDMTVAQMREAGMLRHDRVGYASADA